VRRKYGLGRKEANLSSNEPSPLPRLQARGYQGNAIGQREVRQEHFAVTGRSNCRDLVSEGPMHARLSSHSDSGKVWNMTKERDFLRLAVRQEDVLD